MHLQVLKRDGFQIAGYCCEVCSMLQIINRGVLYVSLHGRVASPDCLSLQQFVYSWNPGEGTHMPCGYLLGRADLQKQSALSLHWHWQSPVSGKRRKRNRRLFSKTVGSHGSSLCQSASECSLVSCSSSRTVSDTVYFRCGITSFRTCNDNRTRRTLCVLAHSQMWCTAEPVSDL